MYDEYDLLPRKSALMSPTAVERDLVRQAQRQLQLAALFGLDGVACFGDIWRSLTAQQRRDYEDAQNGKEVWRA